MWLFHPQTSTLLKGKNVTAAVAKTIILPCADAEDPSDHPEMPEAQSTQADHPEVQGQGAPKTTGADQADLQADITTAPQPVALPTVPPLTSLACPLDAVPDNTPPSDTNRIALKSSQHPQPTVLRPLHILKIPSVDGMSIRQPGLILHLHDATYHDQDQIRDGED